MSLSASPAIRAVVTGGATGIGRAITEALLARGASVVVGQPDVRLAAPLVERYGPRVIPLPADVGHPDQCRSFIAEAARVLGGLDVLVNNAAITGPRAIATLAEIEPVYFDEVVRVNLGGVLFCSQAAAPFLKASGRGVIVQISSVNAVRPQRGAMVYAATKAALTSLTQSMAKELAPDGIRVVAVAPGDIRTETSDRLASEAADVAGQTPLGRGTPGDIAGVVSFLCSPEARFVTGVTWIVDGGLLA